VARKVWNFLFIFISLESFSREIIRSKYNPWR